MKSIVQEGSSVAKAIEKALQIAGNPRDFTVKILEEAEKNFFGMTTKPAKISFVFGHDAKPAHASHAERQRTEKPKFEKKSPERQQQQPRQAQKPAFEKKAPEKVQPVSEKSKKREPMQPRQRSENEVFWNDAMVTMAQDWLHSTLRLMDDVAPVDFKTTSNRYYLRVTFAQPLYQDAEKERQVFRNFSYLMLQSLRTKLQRPLRGFKVVLTREGA